MMTTVIGAVIQHYSGSCFYFLYLIWRRKQCCDTTVLSQAVGAIWILRFLSGKKRPFSISGKRISNYKKTLILPCLGLGRYPLCHIVYQKVFCPSVSPPAFQILAEILPGGAMTHYHKCQPACNLTAAGNMPGRTADHEVIISVPAIKRAC